MGSFSINVKPEVIQTQMAAAQTRIDTTREQDINEVVQNYGLDRGALDAGGIDIQQAPKTLALDMFMKLSDNDTKITKADILKFKNNTTPDVTPKDVIHAYANKVSESIQNKVMDNVPNEGKQEMLILESVAYRPSSGEIVLTPRYATQGTTTGRDPAAAMVFSIIGGVDKNADGMIAVGGELSQSEVFVRTTGDAIKLAGSDMMVSPEEALGAILAKAGKIAPEDLSIKYVPGK